MNVAKKELSVTVLNAIDHIISNHPEIAKRVERIVAQRLGKSAPHMDLIFEINKEILSISQSQFGQDIFVLYETGSKKNGYFVEFGASDGVHLSNSYLLEKNYGWTGILAEPASIWHEALQKNRKCHIETDCVWSASNRSLVFNETEHAYFSTVNSFSDSDLNKESRKKGKTYSVSTISLNDLLDKYEAPNQIDYLSIDTEGSEYDILSGLDFDRYSFKVITCEHNYTPMREKIFDLMMKNGYVRKFENISQVDDWYVKT